VSLTRRRSSGARCRSGSSAARSRRGRLPQRRRSSIYRRCLSSRRRHRRRDYGRRLRPRHHDSMATRPCRNRLRAYQYRRPPSRKTDARRAVLEDLSTARVVRSGEECGSEDDDTRGCGRWCDGGCLRAERSDYSSVRGFRVGPRFGADGWSAGREGYGG